MSGTSKANPRVAFAIAVFTGLIIGKLIKKFAFGLLIGIVVSLIYVLIATGKKKEMSSYNNDKEKVPLFKSWTGWYSLVLLVLCILIVLFYFFTKRFA